MPFPVFFVKVKHTALGDVRSRRENHELHIYLILYVLLAKHHFTKIFILSIKDMGNIVHNIATG
jgi:hypothetical protein